MPILSAGEADGMIVELDAALNPISTIVIGSPADDDFHSMTMASGSDVYVVATFAQSASLSDCDNVTSLGFYDTLLIKLAP